MGSLLRISIVLKLDIVVQLSNYIDIIDAFNMTEWMKATPNLDLGSRHKLINPLRWSSDTDPTNPLKLVNPFTSMIWVIVTHGLILFPFRHITAYRMLELLRVKNHKFNFCQHLFTRLTSILKDWPLTDRNLKIYFLLMAGKKIPIFFWSYLFCFKNCFVVVFEMKRCRRDFRTTRKKLECPVTPQFNKVWRGAVLWVWPNMIRLSRLPKTPSRR